MSQLLPRIILSFIACLTMLTLSVPANAKEDKSLGLYVNLSTDDNVKAGHAFVHAGKMMKRGHPVTYFLNGKAVLIAVKGVPQTSFNGKSLQVLLKSAIAKGAKVLICRVCMKLHDIKPDQLIDGAVRANPELTSNYLFDPSYRVISW